LRTFIQFQLQEQKEKKIVEISCPKLVVSYNSHLRGVDLFDRFMSNFRIKVKGKKWWWRYFANCIDLAASNAWFITTVLKNSVTQLEFRRSIAMSLMTTPMDKENIPNGHGHQPQLFYSEIRLRNTKHDIIKKREQQKNAVPILQQLGSLVALHPKCFQDYHK
jgi:hypothetical protein